MVGGSWRSLGRLDLALANHPLAITHQHDLAPRRPRELQAMLETLTRESGKGSVTAARLPTLPHANLLLRAVVDVVQPAALVVSSYGVREGLLYDDMDAETCAKDPLIEAAREVGAGLGRFAQHGELIDRWIAPAFDDGPRAARLRLATCHLSDIAWAAHPDFRAERGIDLALHGNWVAIDPSGRVLLAAALFASFGGSEFPYPHIAAMCAAAELARARHWGLGIRLAQRLSGGVAGPLEESRLERSGNALVLYLPEKSRALLGEAVERRLKTFATALGLVPETRIG